MTRILAPVKQGIKSYTQVRAGVVRYDKPEPRPGLFAHVAHIKPESFTGYVGRLSRRAAMYELDAAAGGTERTAGASATPERIGAAGLGNNTKSQAAFRDQIDPETLEIQRFRLDPEQRQYVLDVDAPTAQRAARAARLSAQSSATKLLFNHETPRDTQWRVTGCSRRKIAENVAVLYAASVRKAHFGGVMICGSVWTCPPCAAKISERRKLEIKAATNKHTEAGGCMYMVTHTFAHQRNDELAPMMARFAKARTYMREQRGYKNLKIEMGYVGDLRALEVTYGDANGFHPHEHDLWLVADPLTQVQERKLHSVLFSLWKKACAVAGLGAPNRKRGVNVKKMFSADEYMAKFGRESTWGTASELTKQHSKTGKEGRLTSFDLLRLYELGDKRMGALFIQFAKAFFGKRQVVWSKGLKALFGVAEVSDEDVAKDEVEAAKLIIEIRGDEWKAVLRQSYDARALLLDLAETGGAEAVRLRLDRLVELEAERRRMFANKRSTRVSVPGLSFVRT